MGPGVAAVVAGLTLLAAPSPVVWAADADLDAAIAQLKNDDLAVRNAAIDRLPSFGVEAVSPLAVLLGDANPSIARGARLALEKIAATASARPDTAKAVGLRLVDAFLKMDSSGARTELARMIAMVGDDATAAALAPALKDADRRELARWALVRIATPGAARALRDAVSEAGGASRVALIDALGAKRDADSIDLLAKEAASADEATSGAAIAALGRMRVPRAAAALRNAGLERSKVPQSLRQAAFELAEGLLTSPGNEAVVRELLAPLMKRMDQLPAGDQCAVLHLLGRVGGAEAPSFALKRVGADNVSVRAAAGAALVAMPGAAATEAVLAHLKAASPDERAILLSVLGERKDPSAIAPIQDVALRGDEPVRIAAMHALAHIGGADGVNALIAVITRCSSDAEWAAAQEAAYTTTGDDANKAMAAAVEMANPRTAAVLIRALGYRQGGGAGRVILAAASSDEVPVRLAAYEAMGVQSRPRYVEPLLAAIEKRDDAERTAAAAALIKLHGKGVAKPMLDAYGDATPRQKAALLRALSRQGNPEVPRLLARAAKDSDETIRAAAVEGLGLMSDPAVAPTLLEAARQGPEVVTNAALGSYLRTARTVARSDKAAARTMFAEALALAVRDDERRAALDGMSETIDGPGAITMLPKVTPYLEQPALRREAARVAGRIAVLLGDDRKTEAIDVLKTVVTSDPGRDVVELAVKGLRDRGVDVDPAREAGFITQWYLIGPFPNPGDAMFKQALFPETRVDLAATEKVGDKEYRWKPYHTNDLEGVVDLEKVVAAATNVGAYGYAVVDVDKAQDVVFKMGSDDSIVCWVNGEKIHANRVARGLRVDEDKAKAHLKAGRNEVLIKCLNGSSAWAFCVRIDDAGGQPLKFTQRLPG